MPTLFSVAVVHREATNHESAHEIHSTMMTMPGDTPRT
jgi:hypothetical protein